MKSEYDKISFVEKDGKERKVLQSFLCLLSFSKESEVGAD